MSSLVGQGLTDIDSLALAVRDRESRRLIAEAITAYRGGALRSAIMSTWIAVAFDIIAKARELAAQGEAAPIAFIQNLDSAIANTDIRRMQVIESDLLKIANEQLQLFAPHEYDALCRIQSDRNLCAHPAFVVEDELYQPTLELVRAHIVHALQYLLIHAPLQGKSAITRFDADIVSPSFPTNSKDVGAYMRAKYLDRAKDVLVTNLIKALLSAPFGNERIRYAGRIHLLATTLREIAKAKTAIYDSTVPGYVARKFDPVADDVLLSICAFLESDPRIWAWLSEPVRLRIKQLLQTADVETLKAHAAFDGFSVADLAEVLTTRFDVFDQNTQISIIAEHPKREFVERGIAIYSGAGSYRSAESMGQSVIVQLAPHFTADDIRALLDAVAENGQIWCAAGTSGILEAVFDATRGVLADSRQHWQAFVEGRIAYFSGNAEEYYSYPQLQQRLAAT
jgi:hypothetical protein